MFNQFSATVIGKTTQRFSQGVPLESCSHLCFYSHTNVAFQEKLLGVLLLTMASVLLKAAG